MSRLTCEQRLDQVFANANASDALAASIYTRLYVDSAYQSARAADERTRLGRRLGALDGLLFSVKDSVDIQGHTTLAGSPVLSHCPKAEKDAAVVTQLKNAGAVIVGSTHMTELAFSGIGLNRKLKLLRNPLDLTRVTGGSSSGAAASVAAGLADVAIAGDTGGSIRIPAALCGAVGLKPSFGRLSTQGVFPLSRTLDVIGPIAKTVAQCADTFHALTESRRESYERGLKPKLVVVGGLATSTMDSHVANAFSRALMQLARANYVLEDDDFADYWRAVTALDVAGVFTVPELLATLEEAGVTDIHDLDPMIVRRIGENSSMSAVDYVRLTIQRQRYIKAIDHYLSDGRILVLPTVPCCAPEIDSLTSIDAQFQMTARLVTNCRFANLFDLPAITLPLLTDGPAVGLMLVSRNGTDARLIAVAQEIEKFLGE